MTWSDDQRRERERYWPDVERFVAGLPPGLAQSLTLVEFDLAIRCSPSGQVRDVFSGVGQFPLLSVGTWLLSDLVVADGRVPSSVERRLFLASFLLGARDLVVEGAPGGDSTDDTDRLGLVQLLTERAIAELDDACGVSDPVARSRERFPLEGLAAMVTRRALWRSSDPPADPERYLVGRWSASARAVAQAALRVAGRDDIATDVGAMLERTAAAFEILADLSTIHADLLAGRITFPIATVARTAGVPLWPRPDPTVVLGSLVVTGSIGSLQGEADRRLGEARRTAEGLRLERFGSFLHAAEGSLGARPPDRATAGTAAGTTLAAPIVLVEPAFDRAVAMTEGYLADEALQQSTETHREGMFGSPLVVSRFPAGLILEILARHGRADVAAIEAFIDATVANGFRYYDHPSSGIDADTIGVVLRLLPDPASPGGWGSAIEAILDRLVGAIEERGSVPVWIPELAGPPPNRPSIFDLGERCGTVAAQFLIGLARYAPDRHATALASGAGDLLRRIEAGGLAANVNYTPAWALVAYARLLRNLGDAGVEGPIASDGARDALVRELERLIAWREVTPQQAALLTVACLELDLPDRVDPRWRSTILGAQRPDGSWAGESIAIIPNRGRTVAWFASPPLTTAICYDALVRLERSGAG